MIFRIAVGPLNGNYSDWSSWSACSKSCDRGITSRRRSCTNPPPLYNGKDCEEIGPEEEVQECFLKACAGTNNLCLCLISLLLVLVLSMSHEIKLQTILQAMNFG